MRQILTALGLTPQDSTSTVGGPSTKAGQRGHALRLSVAGEIDIATVDTLTDVAVDALRLPVRLLVLDFDGVTFCGAAGVNALVTIRRVASETGSRCVLTGLQPAVEHVLDLVGLRAILRYPAVDAASCAHLQRFIERGNDCSSHRLLPTIGHPQVHLRGGDVRRLCVVACVPNVPAALTSA